MARLTSAQWLDKWSRRLSAAGPDISAGVDKVQTAPGVQAAAAAQTMLANLTQSVTSGAWAARVGSVSLQSWKDATKTKGLNRIASGVQQAVATKGNAIATFLSAVDAAVADANTTPRGGLENNIARSVAFQRSMAAHAPKRQK